MNFRSDIVHALLKNVVVEIGGQKMRCECTDLKCPNNSHKVDLKRKFLTSICANDVELYDVGGFSQVQCYWSNGIVRSAEEQRKYDFEMEEMLREKNYKSMNITELREMYSNINLEKSSRLS